MLKRSAPIKQGKPLARGEARLKRTAIKPKPRKSTRARPDEPLAIWCEVKSSACTGRAEVRHHRKGRIDADADEREFTLDSCDSCHRYLHAHPTESYERGWMLRRT